MGAIKDSAEKVCSLIKDLVNEHYGFKSHKAELLRNAVAEFRDALMATGAIPGDWRPKFGIGQGNLAQVMWVVFRPVGQELQDGIYVGACFGRDGNGFVIGCMKSASPKSRYGDIPTVERNPKGGPAPEIFIDGRREETWFNNVFLTPLDVYADHIDEPRIIGHLELSVEKCKETLAGFNGVKDLVMKNTFEGHGRLPHCWVYSPGSNAESWEANLTGGYMAVDWHEVVPGDLRKFKDEEELRTKFQQVEGDVSSHKNSVRALLDFRDVIRPGDYIFAKKGRKTFVGVGRVTSDYYWEDVPYEAQRRKVEWISSKSYEMSDTAPLKTLTDVTSYSAFVLKLAKAYGLQKLKNQMRHAIWADFLKRWPVEKLRSLTLEQYNKLHGEDAFCRWIEARTEWLGSIWGGSAYKFGIYEYNKTDPKPLDSGTAGDDRYRWYSKYGEDADSVFRVVKQKIVAIAEAAADSDWDAVESIEFSPAVKWKIAFLYQPREQIGLLPVYKREWLSQASGVSATIAAMQSKLVSEMNPEQDVFEYADSLGKKFWDVPATVNVEGEAELFEVAKFDLDLPNSGLEYDLWLVRRFVSALLAKSLVVLTGLSGSGKTKLAQAFAGWIAPSAKRLVPVGADWTNSEHLLGYPNALESGKYVMPETGVLKLMLDARDNPNLPFFLILDEMNLSHVERYFADFLSAMESGEDIKLHGAKGDLEGSDGTKVPPTIKFPKNLFVIGTMNVDETTYMFSPKVLDRAQVIEFRVGKDEMAKFLAEPTTPKLEAIAGKGAKYAEAFLRLKANPPPLDENGSANKDAITAALTKFFEPLAVLGAEFGYRTASEVIRFCRYYLATGADITDAIDAAIVQKLLPKLHGSQQRLGPVLKKLKELSEKDKGVSEGGEAKTIRVPLYKLTWEKLDRMQVRLRANGFTSFAEA